MILALLPQDHFSHLDLIQQMHRLRYRVFHEQLGWEVTTTGDWEIDEYDRLKPIYLLQLADSGQVQGCARLLPSTGPTMLRDTFPILLGDQEMPSSATVWESSRFAVDVASDRRDAAQLAGIATIELFAGLCELGLRMGWTNVATVTDLRLEKLGLRAGLKFNRFAPPRQMGVTRAVAGLGEVSTAVLDAIRAYGALTGPVLTISSDLVLPIAA